MSQALYRKYRSKKLDDIVGQDHITDTLKKAIKAEKLSHAYLFTGPRGVGKTSIARILAHEVNQLPYTDESIHLDIIEIDAASNRRIDEIRDLRDKVHIAPTSAKYKVYIIDEVHMLTKEAFNALLKTLEEPPAHVIFILATTEIHKLPETIVSRTQRFTFKPISHQDTIKHLEDIAKNENIDIDKEALALLAEHAQGSFRDSISLLDQVGGNGNKLDKTQVEILIGVAPQESIDKLFNHWKVNDLPLIVEDLREIIELGISTSQIAKQLGSRARESLINKDYIDHFRLKKLIRSLVEVPASADPITTLELAIFDSFDDYQSSRYVEADKTVEKVIEKKQDATEKPTTEHTAEKENLKELPKEKAIEEPEEQEDIKAESIETTEVSSQTESTGFEEWWPKLLEEVKKVNNTLYGVIRMAQPKINDDELHLGFKFGFHAKKVSDTATSEKLSKAIENVSGRKFKIVAAQSDYKIQEIVAKVDDTEEKGDDNIQAITSVFGGAEVLET